MADAPQDLVPIPVAFLREQPLDWWRNLLESDGLLTEEETTRVYLMNSLPPPDPPYRMELVVKRDDLDRLIANIRRGKGDKL